MSFRGVQVVVARMQREAQRPNRRLVADSADEEIGNQGAHPASTAIHSSVIAHIDDVKTNVARQELDPVAVVGGALKLQRLCSERTDPFWPGAALTPSKPPINHHIVHIVPRSDEAAELLREGLETRLHRYVRALVCMPPPSSAGDPALPARPPRFCMSLGVNPTLNSPSTSRKFCH